MDDATCARSFTHDGFDVRIYLTTTASGFFSGYVDIHESGVHKCRIALSGPLDHTGAIAVLDEKCKDWIAARRRGDPAGDTGFSQP